jgi:hypothetical protein
MVAIAADVAASAGAYFGYRATLSGLYHFAKPSLPQIIYLHKNTQQHQP